MESFYVQDFLVAAVLKNKNQSKLPETKQYLLIFFHFNITYLQDLLLSSRFGKLGSLVAFFCRGLERV